MAPGAAAVPDAEPKCLLRYATGEHRRCAQGRCALRAPRSGTSWATAASRRRARWQTPNCERLCWSRGTRKLRQAATPLRPQGIVTAELIQHEARCFGFFFDRDQTHRLSVLERFKNRRRFAAPRLNCNCKSFAIAFDAQHNRAVRN